MCGTGGWGSHNNAPRVGPATYSPCHLGGRYITSPLTVLDAEPDEVGGYYS